MTRTSGCADGKINDGKSEAIFPNSLSSLSGIPPMTSHLHDPPTVIVVERSHNEAIFASYVPTGIKIGITPVVA